MGYECKEIKHLLITYTLIIYILKGSYAMVTVNNTFKNKDIQDRKDVLNQLFLFIIKESLSGAKSDANEKNE